MKQKPGPSRGVLNREEGLNYFTVARYLPESGDTGYFVEHFWIVRWEMPQGKVYHQDVLSHPSVHLVFEKGNTRIWGVVTGKFTRRLEGTGKVLGIKFRPGGFRPFVRQPVAGFSDQQLPFQAVFDEDPAAAEKDILGPEDDEAMVENAGRFLETRLPERDPKVELAATVTASVAEDSGILKVDDIVEKCGIGKRSLQRLFRTYVGVSPKWVIRRYRLHEAAEKMAAGEAGNWPDMALELGYFDQAHFIRDFKAVVGQTPAEYARLLEKNG